MIRLTPVQWRDGLTQFCACENIMGTARSHFINATTCGTMAQLATGKVINQQPDPIQGHLNPRGRCDSVSSESPNYCFSSSFWPQNFLFVGFPCFSRFERFYFHGNVLQRPRGWTLLSPLTTRKERREFKKKKTKRSGLVWLNLSMVELCYITKSLGIVNQSPVSPKQPREIPEATVLSLQTPIPT